MTDLLVGRRSELERLHAELREVRGGRPRLALVEGSAGVGKSALIRRFLQEATDLRVLIATGDEGEALLPYGVVQQLVRSSHAPVPEPLLGIGGTTIDVRDPLVVGAGLLDLLSRLQGEGPPVAIVVDDAQWADRPSLQALLFTLRRLDADHVLTLVGARDDDPYPLREGLVRLLESGRGGQVNLTGLDAAAIRELAASMGTRISLTAAERIRDHTAGSPLYARSLLHELPAEALQQQGIDVPLPCPRSFGAHVAVRLAGCPPEAQRLVLAASVLGVQCSLSAAARLAALDDPVPALERSMAAELLEQPDAQPATIAFTHPLVRAAVYHGISPVSRREHHARAATVVQDEASALRHRVAGAFVEDDGLAADLAAFARKEADRGAWASAADALVSASHLSARVPLRRDLLLEAVECMLLGGDLSAAMASANEVSAFDPSAHRDYVLGTLALMRGRHEEAERLLAHAFELCGETTERRLVADIAGQLSNLHLTWARPDQGATWAARALDAGRGRSLVDVLSCQATGLVMSGRRTEALSCVAALPDPSRHRTLDSLNGYLGRAFARCVTDDCAGARSDLLPLMGVLGQRGLTYVAIAGISVLAVAEYRLGLWDDAVIHGRLAASIATDAEQLWLLGYAHASACSPLAARGDRARATAHAEAAGQAAATTSSVLETAHAAMAHAQVAWVRGDDAAVVGCLEPLATDPAYQAMSEPGIVGWQPLYVDALVNLGRLADADLVLGAFEALAAQRDRRSAIAQAARSRGRLEAQRGERRAALDAFTRSGAALEGLDMPFESALTDLEHGAFLRRLGKRSAAAALLRAARDRLGALGAHAFLEQCDRELLACGLTPARRSLGAREQLTPQELAVARLAASGSTNRQVAAELLLSVKTVEYHLGNVFGKLGVRSRHQLETAIQGS